MKFRLLSRRTLGRWLLCAALLECVGRGLSAQQTVQAGDTLHVYTNLLQIPVLILSQKHEAVPPIEASRFLLKIGNSAPFRPRVRLEGDDPLTLAVLIDGSFEGPQFQGLSEALATMAKDQLRLHDRIALYGMDGCELRRTSLLRAADAATVRAAVDRLESYPSFQHHWHEEKCHSPQALWDSVAFVTQTLEGEPGRRVVLVVTNGDDAGSRLNEDTVRRTATNFGVAIFALAERFRVRQRYSTANRVSLGGDVPSPLAYICEGSGGLVLETTRNNVAGMLSRFPPMLRGRYIVEFSRPAGILAGEHGLVVTDGRPRDFIRAAGTSMPVADPVAQDPSVQHGVLQPEAAAEGATGATAVGIPQPLEAEETRKTPAGTRDQ